MRLFESVGAPRTAEDGTSFHLEGWAGGKWHKLQGPHGGSFLTFPSLKAVRSYVKRNPNFKQKKIRAVAPNKTIIDLIIPKPTWML